MDLIKKCITTIFVLVFTPLILISSIGAIILVELKSTYNLIIYDITDTYNSCKEIVKDIWK